LLVLTKLLSRRLLIDNCKYTKISNWNNKKHLYSTKPVAERDGSMLTSDAVFQFIVTYLPYQNGDENISLENN